MILILTSGDKNKLLNFEREGVVTASFSDIVIDFNSSKITLSDNTDLKKFKAIYFRLVGKSLEIATVVSDYASKNNIKIFDKLYQKASLLPLSLGKTLELLKLAQNDIPMPRTFFGNFNKLPFPFVVKSTTGRKSREVWLVKNKKELSMLRSNFASDKFYLAQELIENARRIRVLVVGARAIGAIERQTKWFKDEVKENYQENQIPPDIKKLAVRATSACELEICGVDILVDVKSSRKYVIEANAAPVWKLINRRCGVVVEDEIIKYIRTKI